MGKFRDLTGEKFGRLAVIRMSDRPVVKGNRHWVCLCDCGVEKVVSGFHLKSGHTSSCGCLHVERTIEVKTRHGHAAKRLTGKVSPTYETWASMLKRCNNPSATNFERYGGRGIGVCDRWHDFEAFLADMGERPSREFEIDREDNDGNYEPGNCRWVRCQANSRNRRSSRVVDTPLGPMLLADAVVASGLPYSTLWNRLQRKCPTDRLFDPPRSGAS